MPGLVKVASTTTDKIHSGVFMAVLILPFWSERRSVLIDSLISKIGRDRINVLIAESLGDGRHNGGGFSRGASPGFSKSQLLSHIGRVLATEVGVRPGTVVAGHAGRNSQCEVPSSLAYEILPVVVVNSLDISQGTPTPLREADKHFTRAHSGEQPCTDELRLVHVNLIDSFIYAGEQEEADCHKNKQYTNNGEQDRGRIATWDTVRPRRVRIRQAKLQE